MGFDLVPTEEILTRESMAAKAAAVRLLLGVFMRWKVLGRRWDKRDAKPTGPFMSDEVL